MYTYVYIYIYIYTHLCRGRLLPAEAVGHQAAQRRCDLELGALFSRLLVDFIFSRL